MQLLRSKLIELEERKRAEELAKARGEVKDVAWGSQIRSYVLHPYTMVKDHRTEHEVGDVQRVLDGDIDEFVRDYLNKTAAALGLASDGGAGSARAPGRGEPEGLLVLHHGRGTDERDLLGLADALDPERAAAGGDAAGAAEPAGLARLPLVPGAAGRLSRPRHLPRRPRGARRAPRPALGGDRGRARADRARRLLDGRR